MFIHLLTDFFSHPGVGVTIGLITASGMIVGATMVYLEMTRKQIVSWTIAFFILALFIEAVRMELFLDHGEPYTTLPLLTSFVPFFFYVLGIVPGAAIAYHWCVDEKKVLKEMLEEYERKNGHGKPDAKHA